MTKKTNAIFLLTSFGISWGAWISVVLLASNKPLEEGSLPFLLYVLGGLLGPVVGALVSKAISKEHKGFKNYLSQLVKVKVSFKWYLFAFFVPFLLAFTPRIVEWMFTGKLDLNTTLPLYMVLLALPQFIIAGGLEEMGWRGVLLPELLKKYSALTATFILIPIWAVWHLPLWFIKGTGQYGSSFFEFFCSVIILSLFLSILYIQTKSIFICIILHGFMNSFNAIVGVSSPSDSQEVIWTAILVKLLLSSIVFLYFLKTYKKHNHITTLHSNF